MQAEGLDHKLSQVSLGERSSFLLWLFMLNEWEVADVKEGLSHVHPHLRIRNDLCLLWGEDLRLRLGLKLEIRRSFLWHCVNLIVDRLKELHVSFLSATVVLFVDHLTVFPPISGLLAQDLLLAPAAAFVQTFESSDLNLNDLSLLGVELHPCFARSSIVDVLSDFKTILGQSLALEVIVQENEVLADLAR